MIYTVIRKIAYKQNKTIKEIEIAKKLPNGIIGKWDTSMPQADKLQAVADYLGVQSADILKEAEEESKNERTD
ncbi:XRE family transcriptional regulator [Pediococcus inopinatus]|uniref:XRE family transcriptional regulator n=1 Tax=Pediococcus inopinatus TaxID=114090 RepID=UPI002B25CD08|nr:XRE family transcriptional regulator [Pediococcus inopinatus]WPC19491.1 XRE family transcriptional regulator [Pediococcus inopinatus]